MVCMLWSYGVETGERGATFPGRNSLFRTIFSLSLSSRDSHLPLLCHFILFSLPIPSLPPSPSESRSHSHNRHPMTFATNVANLTVHTLSDRCQTCQNPHYQPRPRLSRTFFLKSEFKSHRTFALYRTAFLALWSLLLFLPALPPCSSSFAVSPSFLAVRPIFAV